MNDLISRQAAIDAADRADYTGLSVEDVKKVTDEVIEELKQLPSAQPEQHYDEWCTDCKEYDKERHCCPRFNRVIRTAMADASRWIPVEARLPEDKQKCLLTLSCFQSSRKYVVVGTYVTDLYSVNKYDFADKKGVSGWYYRDSEYGYIEYDSRVIAWMPLPEPYEGGDDNA